MQTNVEFEQLAQRRNDFYRTQFRRMVKLLIVLALVCMGLLATLFFLMWTQKPAKYYASTTTGNVVPIESLSAPVVTQDFILQWSETVTRAVYNLDFLNYAKELQKSKTYFTSDGWQALQAALKDSGMLEQLISKKLYMTAVVNGPAVITNRYISHGTFTWEVQLPLLITYSSASMSQKKQIYVGLTIKRVPELEIARGIAVTNFTTNG